MKLILTYGAWGSLPITAPLFNGLKALNREAFQLSLTGHDGELFTEEMGGWGLKDYENDIMERLPYGDVSLVSHSMTAVCAFNLAQQHQDKIKSVVMIDSPMMGGGSNMKVNLTLMRSPLRYLMPMLSNKPFTPTRKDAKVMLFNGRESPYLDGISNQPASGKAIRQMVYNRLPKKTVVPCTVIVATQSALHPATPKKIWASATESILWTLDESHCGIMDNPRLPYIVNDVVEQMTQAKS